MYHPGAGGYPGGYPSGYPGQPNPHANPPGSGTPQPVATQHTNSTSDSSFNNMVYSLYYSNENNSYKIDFATKATV